MTVLWRAIRFEVQAWIGCLLLLWVSPVLGAELEEGEKLFLQGRYDDCIKLAEGSSRSYREGEDWNLLLSQALMMRGRYPEAFERMTNALGRFRGSIRLRYQARQVFLHNDQPARAKIVLEEINDLAGGRIWAYRDPLNLVVLGKTALLLGAEAKLVLDHFFERAKSLDPNCRDVYLAMGELALDKEDFALAGKMYREGLKLFPKDPDLLCGLAKAYEPSDREEMLRSLHTALEQNTNHVAGLLLLADHLVDAEQYKAAQEILQRILRVNPWHPEAWAYRAVLGHLAGGDKEEAQARAAALRFWPANPRVHYLIGKKLSQKYRFAEGADHQLQALRFDDHYLPAKIQLAQDLLRLGRETEGWQLAESVHQADGYNVMAYNLAALHDTLRQFHVLTNDSFAVRMHWREAGVYGDRVLRLLAKAKNELAPKYGLTLTNRVAVEIFPEQKDFGVRTFGMPENPGFLGVCFGNVITANSPASAGANPANWEAVLWHEFCHTVTLTLTRNRMPRWLSEGISVFEERLANSTWGQEINPAYRELILEGKLTPIGELSAAFLKPKNDRHLQFAYYESSLAVEFIVKKFGFDSLKAILKTLADGTEINPAIETHTAPLPQLEKDFKAFTKERAQSLAPGLDWTRPKSGGEHSGEPSPALERNRRRRTDNESPAQVLAERPNNFYGLLGHAQQLIDEKKWADAKTPLQKLITLYPNQTGAGNAYFLLAAAHRALNETDQEQAVLSQLAEIDAGALEAFLRLIELASAKKQWPALTQNAERTLAVQPLLPAAHLALGRACEETGQTDLAIAAYRKVLLLEPADPAEIHFRLARLLHRRHDPEAKRHVLKTLEDAPRFREAHQLLLAIKASEAPLTTPSNNTLPSSGTPEPPTPAAP